MLAALGVDVRRLAALAAARKAAEQRLAAATATLAGDQTPEPDAVKTHLIRALSEIDAAFKGAQDVPAYVAVGQRLQVFDPLAALLAQRVPLLARLTAADLADPADATAEDLATLPAETKPDAIRALLDAVPPSAEVLATATAAIEARKHSVKALADKIAERKRLAAERQKILDELALATDPPGAIEAQRNAIELARQKVRDALPPMVDAPGIAEARDELAKVKAAIEAARSAIAKRATGSSFKTDGADFAGLAGAAQLTRSQKKAIDRLIETELKKSDAEVEAIDFRTIAQSAIAHVDDVAKVKATYSNGTTPSSELVQKFEQLTALAHKSPTMKDALYDLQGRAANQFPIKIVPGMNGACCSRASLDRQISISENYATSLTPAQLVQTIAHEAGHAKYTPSTDNAATTQQQWVDIEVRKCLIDEAEATLFNCQVRQEILDAGGEDIGVAGAGASSYIGIYEQYKANAITREQALDRIASSFGTSETTSTDGQNYDSYYRNWARGAAPGHLPP
ncbi:MAG: hypothetical protein ACP5NP_12145 [Acetobacteraceae bacterium]